MNTTYFEFNVASKEKQFLSAIKAKKVPIHKTNDKTKYSTVIPVYSEPAFEELMIGTALDMDAEIHVAGFYQDPGTGESSRWTFGVSDGKITEA